MTNQKEEIEYSCPNGCTDPEFYQCGTVEAAISFGPDGEEFDGIDYYDFTPHQIVTAEGRPDGQIRCKGCFEPAKKKTYKTTIMTTRELVEG